MSGLQCSFSKLLWFVESDIEEKEMTKDWTSL